MAYHVDLLDQASHLANRDRTRPKQVNLRRAVSTAYYAPFHLLVDGAVSYWRLERQRSLLARSFDHRKMKGACGSCHPTTVELRAVARAFVDLQKSRHLADYDNAKEWTKVEALTEISNARSAFAAWEPIKTTTEAQDFLLALFAADRR
jgi:uncharacterized protein (UPF0332 family)